MALQNADILLAMQKDLSKKLKAIRVDGGACQNALLMQLQANYLGVSVDRPRMIETTSLGAAYLAGLGVGFWKDLKELQKIWRLDQSFASEMNLKQRQKRFESWHQAIQMLN